MLDALAITDEEAAGLSELAALDLAMARDFAARARAADDPAVANDFARSYQRVARSYRQTLALKMRLARELAAAEREGRLNPPPFDPRAARRRLGELKDAVARVAFAEYEGPEPRTNSPTSWVCWTRSSSTTPPSPTSPAARWTNR